VAFFNSNQTAPATSVTIEIAFIFDAGNQPCIGQAFIVIDPGRPIWIEQWKEF
jgi:hypothetical protein